MNITELTNKILRLVYTLAKWVLGIFALAIFVAVAVSLFQQSQDKNSIENGMTRVEVIAELGEPRLELEELGFCTDDAWLGDCEAARQSGAVTYLLWKYGIDTYFVIGLDEENRVVFHDMGDA
ncbi:MAG: hypothetical protein KAJ65_04445 [Gammaproteobacteria bacterium]|nr:hypothetical protein [Gammaproteobacteria bacterium]